MSSYYRRLSNIRKSPTQFSWNIVLIIAFTSIYVPQNSLALSRVRTETDSIDARNRIVIQDYVERAINAHYIRDEKLLAEFWSVAVPDTSMRYQNLLLGREFEIKRETYWYKSLCKIFRKEKQIRVVPLYVSITEHPLLKRVYGVSLHLDIKGEKYLNEGYMFMVWDFRKNDAPKIHIRAWQPAFLDKEKTKRIDSKDLFSLADFDL